MAPSEPPIVFYDIASGPPLRTFAPNPWKTRFALNFKGVNYRTQWVQMPDIHALRTAMNVPANRNLPDGSPYHTLPVVQDTDTGKIVGDSFEIALYLDNEYPGPPSLFRPNTVGLTAAFNNHVDALFTKHVALCSELPFDPKFKDEIMGIFAKRFGVTDMNMMQLGPQQREEMFVSFEAALEELARAYYHTGGTTDHIWGHTRKEQSQKPPPGREDGGVFLDGNEPAYADFIVGAWLKNMQESLPKGEWERVSSWQGGRWGRLVAALEKWAEIK